jgi:hypothetical protein
MPRHKSRLRLRYRTRDLDLIDHDLKDKSTELLNQEVISDTSKILLDFHNFFKFFL